MFEKLIIKIKIDIMAVKIRLARHGRKRYAYYHIVVADSRSPRDGRFIERIGSYNPNTNPATIELDFDKALQWYKNGAQPTLTAKRILSYKGVLMMKHLLDGVKKGAFDENEAQERFNTWLKEKSSKINEKIENLSKEQIELERDRLKAEQKVNQERAEAIAKKYAAEAQLIAQKQAEENAVEEETLVEENVTEESPVVETTEEAIEEPVAEPVEEIVVEPEAENEETKKEE